MMQTAAHQDGFFKNCVAPVLRTGRCNSALGRFVGTAAIVNQEGFRSDGSYRYGAGRYLNRQNLNAGFLVNAMPGAPSIDPNQMRALERIAALARDRGITLVGVQLPFVKDAIDYLDTSEIYRFYAGVWREFEGSAAREQFKQLGIAFVDLSRSPLTRDLDNFIDAYHPSEIGMLRSLQELLADPQFRSIFPKIDRQLIAGQIREAERHRERFYVYED